MELKRGNKNETKKTDFYIELKGSQTLYVPLGSEYVEYGATAYDKQDGQVNVIITGSVDNSNPGHYPICIVLLILKEKL